MIRSNSFLKPRKIHNPSLEQQKPDIPICMEQKHNHLTDVQASLSKPTPNLIKRRKRFESMKKLLNTKKTPWSLQVGPDQIGKGICTEEDDDEETCFFIRERPLCIPPKPKVVSQKPNKHRSLKEKRAISRDLYGKVEVASAVMERAEAVQANLDAKFPSFIKPMIRSNVTRGFWLSLPNLFCKLHMPRHDTTITLIDESQRVYSTKYLVERTGLSAGWRGFSIAHNLVEGDVLVFHLVEVCRMKVYIVRANHLGEVDAALSLLHLDARARQMDPEQRSQDNRRLKESSEKCLYPCHQEVPSEQWVVKDNVYRDLSLALEGLITETLSIADAVKANKIIVSPNDFAGWKKRSICFEHLHDSLGRIRARLDHLVFRILESNEAVCRKRSRGAGYIWDHGEETRTFKVKMLELKEATERLNAEIEVLKINSEMHKITF